MPEELLRDVLRTAGASDRSRGRWSLLPISIAVHCVAAALLLIVPLAAEVEPPPIAPPSRLTHITASAVPEPPSAPAAAPRTTAPTRYAPPLEAPSTISAELPPVATHPGVDGGVGVGVEPAPLLSSLSTGTSPPPVVPAPPPVQPRLVRPGEYGLREPTKVLHVAPVYPEIARRAQVDGTVILEAVIGVTGRVERVRVVRSVPLLDAAATRAVEGWQYTPTTLNGAPVPVLMTVTVRFTLNR